MYKKVIHVSNKKIKKTEENEEVNKKQKKFNFLEWIGIVPVLIIIAFIPLIVYAKVIELSPIEELNWIGSGNLQIEFFSYYKALFFIVATVIAFVVLVVLHLLNSNRIVKSNYYIPMIVYTFFVFLSYVFAIDKTIASRGFIDMHQGVYVLISYMLITFVTINIVKHKKHVIAFVAGFVLIGIIVSLIGIGQYFGYDIFTTDWGILLILPNELESIKDEVIINFDLYGIYATMGNSNFVGSFAALMIPLGFTLFFYAKKHFLKLSAFLFLALMIFVTYGSNSRAGFIGVIFSVFFSIILYRKQFIKRPINTIISIVAVFILGYLLNTVSGGKIVTEIQSMDLIGEIKTLKEYNENRTRFENIEVSELTLTIETSDQSIVIEKRLPTLYAYQLNGEPLDLIVNNGVYTFSNPDYQNFRMILDVSNSFFVVRAYNRELTVYHTIDGLKILDQGGQLVVTESVDRLKFLDEYESLFSSRVYIWSRSIPLLKNNIFIGSGPDMFTIEFPQNDFSGKFNTMGFNTIVDKPHNMFLQIGINTGVMSLLAIIILWGIYIIDSLKLYFIQSNESFLGFLGISMFLSVIAYLLTGIFNDQVISVAPLFYIMLGLGVAINRINSQNTA